MEDIFKKDLSGAMVSPDEPGYDQLIGAIFDTMKLAYELNDGYHTPDEVRDYLSRITGQEIDPSVTLLPPFYVDFGKNIRMGKRCWIQQGCTFFDRGGITIGNDVFIAPKVNLITINHDPDPDNRSATYGRPIVIEDKVWIGIGSTVLPGVRIGYGAIVGANSVVTHDVPPMTVVGGNPAPNHQENRGAEKGVKFGCLIAPKFHASACAVLWQCIGRFMPVRMSTDVCAFFPNIYSYFCGSAKRYIKGKKRYE